MTAEIAGHTGFDWVCIDAQHGPMGTDTMLAMLQVLTLTGTPTFVRTPWHDPGLIMKVLDGGAVGVIVPMGSTASEAAAAAAACRYPPRGIRSMGPSRAQFLTPCYSARVGDSIALCVPMIETLEGVENVERIVEVPGVDGIFIGPGDLSLAEGYPPALAISAPDHVDRVMRVLEAYLRRRVVPGIYSGDTKADFDLIHQAGMKSIGWASGLADPGQQKALAASWSVDFPTLDCEGGIRGKGAWTQPWLDTSGFGLYMPYGSDGSIFNGMSAPWLMNRFKYCRAGLTSRTGSRTCDRITRSNGAAPSGS